MGSWDYFCAICGGPFLPLNISRKPRTARFIRKWARKAEKCRERNLRDDASVSSSSSDGSEQEQDQATAAAAADDDAELLDSAEEDGAYDPDIISEEEVRWTETLYVLGFNPEAEGSSKAFVAGPGQYQDFSTVSIDDLNAYQCYNAWDTGEPLYPFHWCCYEVLARCLTGSFDAGKLDGDLLYGVMRGLTGEWAKVLDGIDYGDACWMHEQYWRVTPGYEYLVSQPRDVPGAKETLLSMFEARRFETLSPGIDPGERVWGDPFARLPYDLVCKVSSMLDDGDVFNLMNASWPIHELLRDIRPFWLQRLRTSTAWFFELHELLGQDEGLLRDNDPKRILIWTDRMIRPKRWITGPFIGVVNRRRVWSVCEQLGERYITAGPSS